ncbi:hypothetical protein [Streptomyces sp. SudanB52_2052]|uniref:hypothetical protein n=1 Tax=Streptomyces sp. SudanB52_2052 TaxID=3035276 RepID=UPI003F543C3B
MRRKRVAPAAPVACAAALAAVGLVGGVVAQDPNGVEDLPPNEIVEKAVDATKSADSLRLKGVATSGPDEVRMDLAVSKKGDCKGTISPREGITAEIIKVGDAAYLKGDEAFWKDREVDAGEAASLLADQWLKLPAGQEGFGELAEVCDADNLLKDVPDPAGEGLTKGKVHEVDGRPAVPVSGKDGDVTGRMEVATEGEPYILRISETGGDEPVDVRMTDHNKPVDAKAPHPDDVLELGDLE